jgi:hypothetical protein
LVQLYGSGGRAAAALSKLTSVELHTFFPEADKEDVVLNMAALGVDCVVHPSHHVIEFHYHFPLSPPRIAPVPLPTADDVTIQAEHIVRFGCLEGEMVVHAKIAVYDPQSGGQPAPFGANGSTADRLALVLNESELFVLSAAEPGEPIDTQVARLSDNPEVVIVKSGPHGAAVFLNGKRAGEVPVYKSENVYKIGSGDIFTAMFALGWIERGLSALEAANQASRYVAHYVETRLPEMPAEPPIKEPWSPKKAPGKVYLAGSFFSTEHRWLVEETRAALLSLGIPCFSPLHDVGVGTGKAIAEADIAGLDECEVVLALLSDMDPGSLVEVGYAVRQGLKVIAVVESPGPQDLTMVGGLGCSIQTDLATAVYHAAWASME